MPDDEEIETQRRALPTFPAHDMRQLLEEAQGLAGRERISRDEAVAKILKDRLDKQVTTLLQALELIGNDPNWREAFIRLAQIHHNAGRLVHRWIPTRQMNSATRKELKGQQLVALVELANSGLIGPRVSKSEAIRQLAKQGLFPSRQRRMKRFGFSDRKDAWSTEKQLSKSEQVKQRALRRAYYRAKSTPMPADLNPLGISTSRSNFEELLWYLENRPDQAVTCDK